jgi:hypothetical protein
MGMARDRTGAPKKRRQAMGKWPKMATIKKRRSDELAQ